MQILFLTLFSILHPIKSLFLNPIHPSIKMKFILFLLLFLFPLTGSSQPLSQEKAQAIATRFLTANSDTRSDAIHLKMVWDGESFSSRANTTPSFYVFNNESGRGFVIVSNDQRTLPILAYSFDENFELAKAPTNFKYLLECYRQEILHLRKHHFKQSLASKKAWAAPLDIGTIVHEYETANWEQGAPYNDLCPLINGKRAYTGCGITATAIVMKYHQWPTSGKGTIPAYRTKSLGIEVPAIPLGHTYQWDKMLMDYGKGSTEEQAKEVATLMRDIGAMCKANYLNDGTGVSQNAPAAPLAQFMRYNPNVHYRSRSVYNESTWLKLIKDEIAKTGPIYYAGKSEQGDGHAFVLDGYTSKNYFHVNWGWGGQMNCFTLISVMAPNGQNNGYSLNQGAIFGMVRNDEEYATQNSIRFLVNLRKSLDSQGLCAPYSLQITPGEEILIDMSFLTTEIGKDMEAELSLQLRDKNNQLKKVLDTFSYSFKAGWQYPFSLWVMAYEADETPQEGDVIRLYYRPKGTSEEWKQVVGNEEAGCRNEIPTTGEYWEGRVNFDETTSIRFNKTERIIRLKVDPKVTAHITKPDYTILEECQRQADNQILIDTKKITEPMILLRLSDGKAWGYYDLKLRK